MNRLLAQIFLSYSFVGLTICRKHLSDQLALQDLIICLWEVDSQSEKDAPEYDF